MIRGAHVVLWSTDAEADRGFFRDVLKYPSADAGHGWLIFALPPAEIAIHPSDENDIHELYLMCDDVKVFMKEMKAKKITCSPVEEQRWGTITRLVLPGGGTIGVYQPKHASPLPLAAKTATAKKTTAKKAKATSKTKAKAAPLARPNPASRRTRRG